MNSYGVRLARSARKELERLPSAVAKRVFQHLEKLADNPRPAGCQKLEAEDNLWRIRVGDYRVVYFIDHAAKTVLVRRVRHRRDLYR